MRAIVYHGQRDIRVGDVPAPGPPGPGFLKLAVIACGICGSDLREYLEGPRSIPTRPHPLTAKTLPVILGHEFVARVAEVGEGVSGFAAGDRVTLDACWRCGECFWCRKGEYNCCVRSASTGLHADGGMAEQVTVPAYTAYKVPEGISDQAASLTEPASVAVHACRRAEISPGDTVVVLGAGPIGLFVLQAARTVGAGRVIVVEPGRVRAGLASELGASLVLDPREDNVASRVFDLTNGLGADVVFECVGAADVLDEALRISRRKATIVVVGVPEGKILVNVYRLVLHEKQLRGSLGYAHDFPTALQWMVDGRINADRLVTREIPLAEAVTGGFEALAKSRDELVKVLVRP